jgi:epidermal growth factor receptor substrate 15
MRGLLAGFRRGDAGVMGRRSRCLCTLLACAALFALAGFVPRTASADDWSEPAQSVQTSSSTSSATAQNDNTTVQKATQIQTGGSQQSQSTIQVAPTQQSATATSRSHQSATNVASGSGPANQANTSSSTAVSRNSNETDQSSVQQQESAPAPDPPPSEAQSQTSSQSAPTSQHADATATSNQVAPTNINVSVRINSPGDNGPVNQTNSSTANAVGDNANTVNQDVSQTESGGRPPSAQSQSARQDAPTTQVGNATSTSNQVAPTNFNITIRNKSPGDDGAVTQTNASSSTASASNANAANQDARQLQSGAGTTSPTGNASYPPAPQPQPASAGTSQTQAATQSAPTTQTANATAASVQQKPLNGDVSVAVDEDVSDPNGSGRRGTLIQIWIPSGEATQTNGSSAEASAVNSNRTAQTGDQRQTAQSGRDTQLGGAAQTQTLRQSAPTTQTATGGATSDQSGAVNLATGGSAVQTTTTLSKAAVADANETTQTALQVQDAGLLAGGSQVQVVDQTAPVDQIAIAQALATLIDPTNVGADGWSIQTNISSSTAVAGKTTQTTQSAQQVQLGDGTSQVQIIEQSVAGAARAHAQGTCGRKCASRVSSALALAQDLTVWSSSTGEDSSRRKEPGASKKTTQPTPRDGQLPPQPKLPGAGAGTSSGGGGSLWVFAALLIPFALTAPWWARRHGPSAFRRLAGVVVRPERPG